MSLRACTCLCQASSKPVQATASFTSKRAASSSTSHPARPPRGWVLPNFQRAKKSVDLPAPRIQKFENNVSLPNGDVLTMYTTCPRPNITINRDTSNHPLWAFPQTGGSGRSSTAQTADEAEAGRMGRFARKFGQAQGQTPAQRKEPPSISSAQEKAAVKMGQAAGGSASGATDIATEAASKVRQKEVIEPAVGERKAEERNKKPSTTAKKPDKASVQAEQKEDDLDMFDLALEGEVYEESKVKIVEEGKKGKKGSGKKK